MTKQELIKRINEEGYGYSDDPNDSVLADFVLKIVEEETEKINNLKKKYRKKAKRFKNKYLNTKSIQILKDANIMGSKSEDDVFIKDSLMQYMVSKIILAWNKNNPPHTSAVEWDIFDGKHKPIFTLRLYKK